LNTDYLLNFIKVKELLINQFKSKYRRDPVFWHTNYCCYGIDASGYKPV